MEENSITVSAPNNELESQQALYKLLSLTLSDINLEEKLNLALEILFDISWLKLEHKGSVFLMAPDGKNLQLIAKRHLSSVLQEKCKLVPLGHCLCGQAADQNTLIFHSHLDEAHHTRFDGIPDHGHYCQPIDSNQGLLGVLNLYVQPGHKQTEAETMFLNAVADTLSGLIQREQAEQNLRNEKEAQEALQNILQLSLANIPLREKLDEVLAILFTIPWLNVEHKGSIFLADDETASLSLVSKKFLNPILHQLCERVPYGHCLCGQAAQSKKLVFHSHLNEHHHTRFEGIANHGHYCQPILSNEDLIGVLNLYVAPGHQIAPLEISFLSTVANTLAGIIQRDKAEGTQQRLATILEATPDFVAIADPSGHAYYYNRGARQLLGLDKAQTDTHSHLSHHHPEWAAEILRNEGIPNALRDGSWETETVLLQSNGEELPVSQILISHYDQRENTTYLSTIARDISDRKKAEVAAQSAAVREKHFANTVINSLPGIFYLLNSKGQLIRWNKNLEMTTGYSTEQLAVMNQIDLVSPKSHELLELAHNNLSHKKSIGIEVELISKKGKTIPYFLNAISMDLSHEHGMDGNEKDDMAIVGMGIDISLRKELERELKRQATKDGLTGINNRPNQEELLDKEIERAKRFKLSLSIIMFDIDHFKNINDTFGHEVGDDVLKVVTDEASKILRDCDQFGRWGGEEFLILAIQSDLQAATILANRIHTAIASIHIDNIPQVTASFGVGQYQTQENLKDFVKRVDEAMYRAKRAGRNQVMSSTTS